MKTYVYLFAFLVLAFAGCTKDSIDENFNTLGLKKANVPIPMKAEFCMTPNMEGGFILIQGLDPTNPQSYLPKHTWISGHATHFGEIRMAESPSTFVSAQITPNGIRTEAEGKITADNGDYCYFTTVTLSNPMTKAFTGNVDMYGGVGRFEGATGSVVMTGQGSCWSATGTMTYN